MNWETTTTLRPRAKPVTPIHLGTISGSILNSEIATITSKAKHAFIIYTKLFNNSHKFPTLIDSGASKSFIDYKS